MNTKDLNTGKGGVVFDFKTTLFKNLKEDLFLGPCSPDGTYLPFIYEYQLYYLDLHAKEIVFLCGYVSPPVFWDESSSNIIFPSRRPSKVVLFDIVNGHMPKPVYAFNLKKKSITRISPGWMYIKFVEDFFGYSWK